MATHYQKLYKILIADHSSAVRKLIIDILTLHDLALTVIEANDGIEAVNQYRAHKPDLVLLDVEMFNMDGFEALRRIKEFDPQANVIMISTITESEIIDKAKQTGAQDFILKPFNTNKLVITIKENLGKKLNSISN